MTSPGPHPSRSGEVLAYRSPFSLSIAYLDASSCERNDRASGIIWCDSPVASFPTKTLRERPFMIFVKALWRSPSLAPLLLAYSPPQALIFSERSLSGPVSLLIFAIEDARLSTFVEDAFFYGIYSGFGCYRKSFRRENLRKTSHGHSPRQRAPGNVRETRRCLFPPYQTGHEGTSGASRRREMS